MAQIWLKFSDLLNHYSGLQSILWICQIQLCIECNYFVLAMLQPWAWDLSKYNVGRRVSCPVCYQICEQNKQSVTSCSATSIAVIRDPWQVTTKEHAVCSSTSLIEKVDGETSTKVIKEKILVIRTKDRKLGRATIRLGKERLLS